MLGMKMLEKKGVLRLSGLLLGAAAAAGCANYQGLLGDLKDAGPTETPPECIPRQATGAGGAGGASGAGGGSGSGDRGDAAAITPVADSCGVFVSSSLGDDAAPGTKERPLRTVTAAILAAAEQGTPRVYACAEDFKEQAVIPGGITLFGGLDCERDWAWIGETRRTTLRADAGDIPLRMVKLPPPLDLGPVRLEDVDAVAESADPANPAQRGLSSIAALAVDVAVELRRCALVAGDGAPGAQQQPNQELAQAGEPGGEGGEACSASQVLGGNEQRNKCGTLEDLSDDSVGGIGGTGQESTGGAGSPGLPIEAKVYFGVTPVQSLFG